MTAATQSGCEQVACALSEQTTERGACRLRHHAYDACTCCQLPSVHYINVVAIACKAHLPHLTRLGSGLCLSALRHCSCCALLCMPSWLLPTVRPWFTGARQLKRSWPTRVHRHHFHVGLATAADHPSEAARPDSFDNELKRARVQHTTWICRLESRARCQSVHHELQCFAGGSSLPPSSLLCA